jgi:5-methylcytosine-specific restriction protein B
MSSELKDANVRSYWFVGAAFDGGQEDQTARFIKEGIWENGHLDKFLDLVKSVQPGDHIAIKSTYTKKNNLPFDSQGKTVSVMGIKATGIVIENPGDGRTLRVDWTPVEPRREWYFYAKWNTICRELPGNWKSDALIAFTFHDAPQEYEKFIELATTESGDVTVPTDPSSAEPSCPLATPYSIDDILAEGCFLPQQRLVEMRDRLIQKKNLILQGPPGTGKSWLAKRLAYALIGQRDESKVRAVQFHPNLSYEDFIRGWRPSTNKTLDLMDGPFLEMVDFASREPSSTHVVVIEEINRGNPAQIFGEMLTLLEADKRSPDEALELCYRRRDNERVFIPDNLYVIGTMNVADRSLALVDLALRRRFAFIDLEPAFGKTWHDWVRDKCGIDSGILTNIEERLNSLNEVIAADPSLGLQFRVGHSYVTPHVNMATKDPRMWFRQVVLTEIGPLLDEYWFDAPDKAKKARQQLLEGF